jgi:hypothetical protein
MMSRHTGELLEFEIQPDGGVILCVSDPEDDYAHYVTLTAAELAGIAEAASVRREKYAAAHGAGHWPDVRKRKPARKRTKTTRKTPDLAEIFTTRPEDLVDEFGQPCQHPGHIPQHQEPS